VRIAEGGLWVGLDINLVCHTADIREEAAQQPRRGLDVSLEDARQLVEFIRELARDIYVLPHELQKRLAKQP
jgi:hypothetical protein